MKEFLTIRKKVYNFYLDKMTDKVFRFYNKNYLPPTIWYTFNHLNCDNLQPIEKTLNLIQKELPENIKEKFKDNIEIQKIVLDTIKKRNEKYNYRCGLIKLTTWKWKSHIIMDLTEYYQTNTLVLVHNIKTLTEMQTKFKEFTNITPSIYGGWKKEIWNITIMTKKSFCLDFQKIQNNFNLVLIDEAPVGFSKTFWESLNIFFHSKKWIALYWLSWTPQKELLDPCDLEKYFWKLIEVKNQINNWYNYIPKFTMYDYKYLWFYRYENPAEMRTAISENMDRLKHQINICNDMLNNSNCLLILTDRKIEVENFVNNLNSENKCIIWMTWDTSQKQDDLSLEFAKTCIKNNKKVIIVWTIQKVWVWVDIPFIDSVFLASAIKFKSTVIQAIWRALRVHKWKDIINVWIWNDLPTLKTQRTEKIKVIQEEYWITKNDINFITIK